MVWIKERSERKFQVIDDPAKVQGMLRQYDAGKVYYIKGFYEKIEVKILDSKDPNILIVDSLRELEGEMTLYHTFNKQLEIEGAVADKIERIARTTDVSDWTLVWFS